METYADFLLQELSEVPTITVTQLRAKLVQEHAVSCSDMTMRSWLERARATAPKRAIKRCSSDLPTVENLEEHGDYLRGLLEDDPTISFWHLREAMKKKGFLVSGQTMHTWVDRHHGKRSRALLKAPIEGLPCLDRKGLLPYVAELLALLDSKPATTYTQLKELLERKFSMTCSKRTMQTWMQSPFDSMESVSIDALSGIDHMIFVTACL